MKRATAILKIDNEQLSRPSSTLSVLLARFRNLLLRSSPHRVLPLANRAGIGNATCERNGNILWLVPQFVALTCL